MTPREFYIKRLETEEGFSAQQYKDHLGYPTIGYGTLLPLQEDEQSQLNCGPEPEQLRERDCQWLLAHRAAHAWDEAGDAFDWFNSVPASVRAAVGDLSYQLGLPRLKKFRKTLAALKFCRWEVAAVELFDSRYAIQTPKRAERNRWLILQAGALPVSVQQLYTAAGD